MRERERERDEEAMVLSYLTLRKAVGLIGILFPFVLALGAVIFFSTGLRSSISDYYYTAMGDVFVGTLCVIGFFLFSYKGYERSDDIAGDLACIFAVGVALFPTGPEDPAPGDSLLIGYIHFVFAALFFLTLIYFSRFLFTKTDPTRTPTSQKVKRNKVYKACAYIMALCIILIVIYFRLPEGSPVEAYKPVFWLEAIAVVTFGVSWLTKGGAILKDPA